LFSYPLTFIAAFAVLPLLTGVGLTVLYRMDHPRISEFLNPKDAPLVMSIVWGVTAGLAFLGMLVGIAAGMSKASQMIFDAEREEMYARQTYLLERILRQQKNKSAFRKGASTGTFFGDPGSAPSGQGNKQGSGTSGNRDPRNGGRVAASAFEKLDEVVLSD
jgi:hypothetical protein